MNIVSRTPGLAGVIVLSAATIMAFQFSRTLGSRGRELWTRSGRPVLVRSVAAAVLALIFLGWAIKKAAFDHEPDAGLITFPIAIVAGLFSSSLAMPGAELPRIHRATVGMGVACALIVAHYLVVLFGVPNLAPVYCVYLLQGAITWAALGYVNVMALMKHESSVTYFLEVAAFEDADPDEYNMEPVFAGMNRRPRVLPDHR
eukprot:1985360-Prymnesium_polylepis.1